VSYHTLGSRYLPDGSGHSIPHGRECRYGLRHGYLINVSTEGCDLGLVGVDRAKIWI
jgi:hypothetical protein